MLDPRDLYVRHGAGAALDLAPRDGAGPVLVHALTGFIDAGSAGQLAA